MNKIQHYTLLGVSSFTFSLSTATGQSSDNKDKYSYFSFEKEAEKNQFQAQGITTSLTDEQSIHGDKSLKIAWTEKGGSLTLNLPIEAINSIINQAKHTSVYHQWIYNPEKSDAKIRIDFGVKGNSAALCGFDYGLGFEGWRTTLFPFNRMQGTAAKKMDWLRLTIPKGTKAGSILLDLLIPSAPLDRRQASFDQSYKFDKEDLESRVRLTGHRDIYNQGLKKIYTPEITQEQNHQLILLENKLQARLLKGQRATKLSRLKSDYTNKYQLGEDKKGRHVFNTNLRTLYGRTLPGDEGKKLANFSLQSAGSTLKRMIVSWQLSQSKAEKEEIEKLYIGLMRHLLKSGWHKGHGSGFLANFGYTSREFYQASFLGRKLLAKHHLKQTVAESLQWLNYGHYSFEPKAVYDYANADHYSTMTYSQLLGLMLTKSPSERFAAVKQYSDTLDKSIRLQRHGNSGGFKEDGTLFHHWGHYPAYQGGAMNIIAYLFRELYDTPFQLSKEAHQVFEKTLLAERFNSNLTSFPRTLSGRHAYPENGLAAQKVGFVDFAFAGSSNQEKGKLLNQKVARAAIRLFPDTKSNFPGLTAEPSPHGHQSFPYANVSSHRRHDWLAIARGHSKYVWGSEIYGEVNHYARYQSHGVLELLPKNGLAGAGMTQQGWDWARPSGATVTHLPLEKMPFKSVIKMYSSDETFAGNINMDNEQGMFALQLNEPNIEKDADVGVKAKKTYSFFDDMIICLGSDISGVSANYPVETVLFQQHLKDPKQPQQIYGDKLTLSTITQFPWQSESSFSGVVKDLNNSLYYLPETTKVKMVRKTQHSYYHYKNLKRGLPALPNPNKKQNAATKGDYSVAVIDHGIKPNHSKYEYAIIPFATKQQEAEFISQIKQSKPYFVLQQDNQAHIVHYKNYTSYALFTGKTNASSASKLVKPLIVSSSSRPCLAMTKKSKSGITLNISDPDLRLPNHEGGSLPGEIYITNSTEKEILPLTVTLNGLFKVAENKLSQNVTVVHQDGTTLLTFDTRRARTYSFELSTLK